MKLTEHFDMTFGIRLHTAHALASHVILTRNRASPCLIPSHSSSPPEDYHLSSNILGFHSTGTPSPLPPNTCEVSDSILIAPFQSGEQNFNFHGSCEHILVTACESQDLPEFVITVDFLSSNLDMGRVGVRIGEKTIVILEDLSLQSTNLGDPISFVDNIVSYPDGIEITEGGNESTINLSAFGLQVTRRVGLQNILVVNASSLTLDVCGLCGTLQGVLLYGDRRRVAAFGNRIEIEQFADSWRVNPSDQFLREERRDCSE